MEPDIVLRLLELAEPGTSFDDVGGREILKEAADHILAARACAEMMLQGTGQKLGEELARRVIDEHYPPCWISVEERLPDEGVEVLAFADGRRCNAEWWRSEWWHACQGFEKRGGRMLKRVTHWTVLPEPPDESTQRSDDA